MLRSSSRKWPHGTKPTRPISHGRRRAKKVSTVRSALLVITVTASSACDAVSSPKTINLLPPQESMFLVGPFFPSTWVPHGSILLLMVGCVFGYRTQGTQIIAGSTAVGICGRIGSSNRFQDPCVQVTESWPESITPSTHPNPLHWTGSVAPTRCETLVFWMSWIVFGSYSNSSTVNYIYFWLKNIKFFMRHWKCLMKPFFIYQLRL